MVRVAWGAFLSQLAQLFKDRRDTGSVYVSFKRFTPKSKETKGKKHHQDGDAHFALVRAFDGKHVKVSCTVSSKEWIEFQRQYDVILRAHADGLKKRSKEKKEKGKKKTERM